MSNRYKLFIKRGAFAGAIIAAVIIGGVNLLGGKPSVASASGERDCEATSVMWCGALSVNELINKYNTGDVAPHHYDDIPAIYASFGITAADVNGLQQHMAVGQVRADGTVWMNGVQIGEGAMTAGRAHTTHSVAIPGTGAFKRPPSDSFARPTTTIDAFIGLDANGQPAWAILQSCGNPIIWNRPHTSLRKEVQDPTTGQFVKDATFTNGATATYRLTAGNSGTGDDGHVKVADTLPAQQTYVAGSTRIDGNPAPDGLTTGGLPLLTFPAGAAHTITFQARISVPATQCGATNMVNTAIITSDHNPGQQDTATTHVTITCVKVKAVCTSLSVSNGTIQAGQTVLVTANVQLQNTTVTNFVFSVDGQVVQTSNSGSYTFTGAQEGTHTISVIVKFADGTQSGEGICVAPITVTPQPPAPCTIPGKESLPANSPDCVLPKTGAGTAGMVGVFVGTSAVAGFGYAQVAAHRRRGEM